MGSGFDDDKPRVSPASTLDSSEQKEEVDGSAKEMPPEIQKSREADPSVQENGTNNEREENDASRTTDVEKGMTSEEHNPTEDSQFVVFWDSDNDPANPQNWTSAKKWSQVWVISAITLITPLASSMFAPGVPEVMQEFNSNSITLASFVVSVYLIGYAFGPLVMAPLSELYGRLWVYHGSNVGFIVLTVACAVSSNLNMLIGFRFLEGSFGSTPLVLGSGTIGDLFPQQERGKVMAIWAMGPLIGPVVGPIAGGFLAQAEGWRWVFWVIAIAAGVVTIAGLFVMRETYAPILLKHRARSLRKSTGNLKYRSKLKTADSPTQLFLMAIIRPMKMLFRSPVIFFLTLFMSVVYGYLYLLFTTITEVFEDIYGFSPGTVGLSYLGIGVGMFIGLGAFGAVSDAQLKKKAKLVGEGGQMKPEWRLPPMLPGAVCVPIGFFWYGWSAQKQIHWIMPIIGTGWVGLGLIGTFMPIQTYLVDAFTLYAASATAANTVARSLVGAVLPLAGRPLYQKLDLGWGNSLLGFIALAMIPIPLLFIRYGEYLRTSPRFKVQF
ncbi:MAG: hypothetical protein Q9227_000801 [Pyrenula ochraceoflavens]